MRYYSHRLVCLFFLAFSCLVSCLCDILLVQGQLDSHARAKLFLASARIVQVSAESSVESMLETAKQAHDLILDLREAFHALDLQSDAGAFGDDKPTDTTRADARWCTLMKSILHDTAEEFEALVKSLNDKVHPSRTSVFLILLMPYARSKLR